MVPVKTRYGPAWDMYIPMCEGSCKRGTGRSVYVYLYYCSLLLYDPGAPCKHLVCVRQPRITQHDIVAPAGAAEGPQVCPGRAGCFGSNGRRWGGHTMVPGSSTRGSAGSEVSTTSTLSDSSSSKMQGHVGLGTPDEGGISRNLLRRQECRCGECSSASGVVPLGRLDGI